MLTNCKPSHLATQAGGAALCRRPATSSASTKLPTVRLRSLLRSRCATPIRTTGPAGASRQSSNGMAVSESVGVAGIVHAAPEDRDIQEGACTWPSEGSVGQTQTKADAEGYPLSPKTEDE